MSRHIVSFILLLVIICLCACEKKEVGKVIVSETEYSLERDGKYTYSLNVNGKIKNIGNVDLKKVVITGYCKTCSEMMISGKWFVTQEVKTDDQKGEIGYIAAGKEEDFSFKDIAYYFTKTGEAPEAFPQDLKVVVESFETVQ